MPGVGRCARKAGEELKVGEIAGWWDGGAWCYRLAL